MLYKLRLIFLIIIITGLLIPVSVNAQTNFQEDTYAVQELTLFPNDPCSLEFRGADVQNVLRSIAIPYKVNLLVSERVKGTITASFHEVPVREVFLAILKDAGLEYVQEGNILRVDTIAAIKLAREETMSVTKPVTKHLQVNYSFDSANSTDLTDLSKQLNTLLSKDPAANLSIVKRTNTLIVTDLPENVTKIEAMLAKLDKPSPQIAITSKIVSATTDFSRELGVQWGGKQTRNLRGDELTMQGGNNTGGWTFNSGGDHINNSSISVANYAVNLPAPAVGAGVGGALNLMFGTVGSNILELQLSAMESESKGKVLANPKVITQDNQAAKMESLHKVFYLVTNTGASGITTQSYNSEQVRISLDVTPHVIENRIFMDVKVEKGNIIPNAAGPPDIKKNTLTTKVLVNSGETIVIGGLIERDENLTEGGIPFLKDIPLIGWLFSFHTKSDEKKELLIFITPAIMEGGEANVQEVLSLK